MIDSDAEFVGSVGFAIGYALLVLFGFCFSVSGLISLYKKEKKEGEKNDTKRASRK